MVIFNRFKYLDRYNEIITVFIKYGFEALLDQLGVLKYLNIKRKSIVSKEKEWIEYSMGERLRLALEELGPTFIKLGQIIGTRRDILSEDIVAELAKLHHAAPPFSFEEVKLCIEGELGEKLEDIFGHFNRKPLAAASIGQVHLASLKGGERVVVKIQRPQIERKIEKDIKILKDLFWFIDNHTKYGKLYDFSNMVEEFQKILRAELDFRIEGENTEKIKKNLEKDKRIVIPEIYWNYTSRRILTSKYIDGLILSNFQSIEEKNIDRRRIAKIISESIFEQILRHGFYHGDPHPGNIMVLDYNKVVFLDFGMVGKLKEERKMQFLKIMLGVVFRNSKLIVEAIISLNAINKPLSIKKLEKEIDDLRDKYVDLSLNEIKLAEIFNEIFDLTLKYNIKIPNEFTMLVKTLATTEGVVEKLDSTLNILEIVEPMAKRLMLEVFLPQIIKKDIKEGILDYGNLIRNFPDFMLNFLRKVEEEDYTFYFRLKDTDKILKRFDKITNKISFSIALLSLSIIIAGLIIGFGMATGSGAAVYLFNLSILKLGLVAAVFMYLWLIFSIFRTGRF